MSKAGDKRGVQGRVLSLVDCSLPTPVGSSFASDSGGGVSPVRLLGHALRPIAGVVPCAGPKVMLGRFSMTRLQPHVGRTPIIHHVLYIEKERYCSTAIQMTRISGESQLCIVRRFPTLVDSNSSP